MRRGWMLWLVMAACADPPAGKDASDDTDAADDTDPGVADDTDAPRTWEPVVPVVRFNRTDFEGLPTVTYVPDDPKALLFVFHGTGGNGPGLVDTVEATAVLNAMVLGGVGFVASSSTNRQSGVFDDDTRPDDNDDWQVLTRMRQTLIDGAAISEDLPVFALGYSAGGAFAAYVGHAGVDAGWPMRGVLLHNASGGSGRYGDPSSLPTMWMCAENDDRVTMASCRDRFDGHADGTWSPHAESRLEPTRFVRTGSFTAQQSRQVFRLAVDNGYFSERGERLFGVDEIDAKVREFTSTYDVIYPKPVTAALNVVLAAHAFNGEYADDEAAFVLAAVDGG